MGETRANVVGGQRFRHPKSNALSNDSSYCFSESWNTPAFDPPDLGTVTKTRVYTGIRRVCTLPPYKETCWIVPWFHCTEGRNTKLFKHLLYTFLLIHAQYNGYSITSQGRYWNARCSRVNERAGRLTASLPLNRVLNWLAPSTEHAEDCALTDHIRIEACSNFDTTATEALKKCS